MAGIQFVALDASLLDACKRFNARLRAGMERPPFELPEAFAEEAASSSEVFARQHWVALDAGGEVRGGVLVQSQPGWLQGQTVPVINIQSPLSEGIVSRRYSMVGLQILQFLAAKTPYLYAVGMGSMDSPFAKLLSVSRWQVGLVPFYFHVLDGSAFLREIGPLRNSASRGPLARVSAAIGAGAVGAALWRWSHAPSTSGYTMEPVSGWGGFADAIWSSAKERIGFGLVRDERTLPAIFPASDARIHRFLLRHHGRPVGWAAAFLTQQHDSKYFGNLRLATILDGLVAEPSHLPALLRMTREALGELSAQLVILNQCHQEWLQALPGAGFLSGPSNYVGACSKPLGDAVERGSMQITRADGDGRIHL